MSSRWSLLKTFGLLDALAMHTPLLGRARCILCISQLSYVGKIGIGIYVAGAADELI